MRVKVETLKFYTHEDAHRWTFKFMLENAVKYGEIPEISKISTFSIEYSEAAVRDFDMNPSACESWDLELSNAQGIASIQCIPSPLKLDD